MVIQRALNAVRNPAQLVLGSFITLILVGTVLLSLPIAFDPGAPHNSFVDNLFWSTSASTVTGLSTTDISHFSLFGELVLLGLIQLGGFGIMTIGSVIALVLSHRVGLRQRMLAQAEIGAVDIGELRFLIAAIARITIIVEASIAVILFIHLVTADGVSEQRAAYSSIFHAVSAFNNAGISLNSDSLTTFATDALVVLPVTFAFILGGLGFPIIVEFARRVSPRRWSLHTRITLAATAALLVIGPVSVLILEWTNPATLGPMNWWQKLLAAWFQGVTPRTAGFNTVDIGNMNESTLSVITGLMFIGAGPASTSGGIKVTTFAILAFAMWAEITGSSDVNVFRRRIPPHVIRQAMTVALLAVGTVFSTAVLLTLFSGFSFSSTIFEAASAFGTVGLSMGITPHLPVIGDLILIIVMLAGRVGPITFVAALAMRQRTRLYRFPEERPIIG